MPVQLISQTAYARHRGCDEKAVRKAIAAGRIRLIDGMIDPEVADIQWARNTRARGDSVRPPPPSEPPAAAPSSSPAPAGNPDSTRGHDYSIDRARRERAEADMAELKLQEQRGDLVRVAEVRAQISRQLSQVRSNLLQLPARLAPQLAGESDNLKVHVMLETELRAILAEIVS